MLKISKHFQKFLFSLCFVFFFCVFSADFFPSVSAFFSPFFFSFLQLAWLLFIGDFCLPRWQAWSACWPAAGGVVAAVGGLSAVVLRRLVGDCRKRQGRYGDRACCAALRRLNCTLVLQFMIVSIASLIGLKFSMFCNCTPGRISKLIFDFERLFHFGPLPLIHAIWPLIDN